MRKAFGKMGYVIVLALLAAAGMCVEVECASDQDVLGPQSKQAVGEKRVLMVAVRFPDAQPTFPLDRVKQKAVQGFGSYIMEQSYGQASIAADFIGYVNLPDSLEKYKISPYNFKVDRNRVRKLVEDTMEKLPADINLSRYDHMLIIPAVQTTPGKGYGMLCYCANPGMLSGVRNPRLETLRSNNGREFKGGVFVGAENAHMGMFAHDYLHALGGLHEGKRLAPCLYDYERQSDASAGTPSFDHHAIYLGPYDVMSQHFIDRDDPPPGLCSFTRIRLGWIKTDKVRIVKPGDTSHALLSPLNQPGGLLVVRIPLSDGTYYLIENRQAVGFDRILPDSGILVYKVDPKAAEGYGTVKLVNADPKTPKFARTAYRLDDSSRSLYIDRKNKTAIIPLWKEGDSLGVLVTSPEKSSDALSAAIAIGNLMRADSGKRAAEQKRIINDAVAAFKSSDFQKSLAIARQGF